MTLLKLTLAPTLLAALLACTETPEPQPDPEAAAEIGQAEPLPHTLPAPNTAEPRFVGLWATSAQGCEQPAWRFRRDGVATRGEVSCSFDNITMTDTGYQVAATCHAEGETTSHAMQFAFAESARAMMVSDGPWAGPTSLVYCGSESAR